MLLDIFQEIQAIDEIGDFDTDAALSHGIIVPAEVLFFQDRPKIKKMAITNSSMNF